MSHVRRKPSRHPERIIDKKQYKKKISKRTMNLLIFAIVMIIVVFSTAATVLLFTFS